MSFPSNFATFWLGALYLKVFETHLNKSLNISS